MSIINTKSHYQLGRVFPTPFCRGLEWSAMRTERLREPIMLSYLPLSRQASSQTPTDPKAFLQSQCHPTTPSTGKPSTLSYTKPATVLYFQVHTPVNPLVDWQDKSCPCVLVEVGLLVARLATNFLRSISQPEAVTVVWTKISSCRLPIFRGPFLVLLLRRVLGLNDLLLVQPCPEGVCCYSHSKRVTVLTFFYRWKL